MSDALKAAIDANDVARVAALMTADPSLHRAPMGYGNNGPLTWVAECRVPWEAPGAARLEMAEWMIANGSDIHQGGDGPLMRAALRGERVPMMELLVAHGADVNAEWAGWFPIIFAPCESVDPVALRWLLEHGAKTGTALDYLIGTYARSADLGACLDLLLGAGAVTRYDFPAVLEILRGATDRLAATLDADRELVSRRFADLDFGATAGRGLTLRGGTLLHVAAEYGNVDAVRVLLDCGADVNAKADGCGQTPLFHAATQSWDWGLEVVKLLVQRGADLAVRAKVPGRFDVEGEMVECTALEYAEMFPEGGGETARWLRRDSL